MIKRSPIRLTALCLSGSILFVLLTASCNATRNIPEDRHLLRSMKIVKDEGELSVRDLDDYVRQKPNKKIFGFWRFHLGLYNAANPDKDNGFNNWLRNIGEEPVIYDPVQTRISQEQLDKYLYNKGYSKGWVTDSVSYTESKADVTYYVHFGEPFRISAYHQQDSLLIPDPVIRNLVAQDSMGSLLSPGMRFDLDELQAERLRLTQLLRNSGFYNFSREYIYFQADTLNDNRQVEVWLGIQDLESNDRLIPHSRYQIGSISIIPDYDASDYLRNPDHYFETADTLVFNGAQIVFNDRLPVKPELLHSCLYYNTGDLYKEEDVDLTIRALSSLRNFKQINVNFLPQESQFSDSLAPLDCTILLSPLTRQSYEVAVEGTHSSGNIGVAGNLIYKHRNLFRGAENFEVRIKGAVEFLADAVADFNRMVEFGVETRLDVPRSRIPFGSSQLIQRAKPNSAFLLSYNYQQRPDFTRTVANAGFGYNWRSSSEVNHRLNLFDINYVNVTDISDRFLDVIQGTYIENSFRSHMIPAFSYILTLSNQEVDKHKSFYFLRIRPEIAGNILTGANRVLEDIQPEEGYLLFGTPYAQYARADFDFRYRWVMNPTNRFAFRVFAGAAYPYGNMDVLPFEKKYFSGGTNGIRAWQVRSLGPGTYVLPEEQKSFYPNQLGDMKIELNCEYRFDLFWLLEGAVFLDAGNIWALHPGDDRPGAQFAIDRFYREMAVGTGFGFRLDLNFFLARLDLGVKLKDPGIPDGPKWIPLYRKYQWSDFVWNFGIGYPF